MGDFFHGWRRKIGVVTLVIALVFMGGWVRSMLIGDDLMIPTGKSWREWFSSNGGSLAWGRFRFDRSTDPEVYETGYSTFTIGVPSTWTDSPTYYEWRWRMYGFGVADNQEDRLSCLILPYWSIAIPLTLLSAYLLLSKPRVATTNADGENSFSA